MTHFEQPSWTRPEPASPGAERTGPPRAGPGEAASLLLSSGGSRPGDFRRIALGLVVLGVVSVCLLNLGIFQTERTELASQGWARLTRGTHATRDEVRSALQRLQRETAYAAGHPSLSRWATRAAAAALGPDDQAELTRELDRAVAALRLHYLLLVRADGTRLAGSLGAPASVTPDRIVLARRTLESGELAVDITRQGPEGRRLIEVACPVPGGGPGGAAPILISATPAGEVLGPLLADGIVAGVAGYAHLVRLDGDQVAFLTPSTLGSPHRTHAALTDRDARAPAMAASGVESQVEVTGRDGAVIWAVTRMLPELGWGLVGEVRRDALMAPLRDTVLKLLLLDLVLLLGVASVAWVWRRQYLAGLARHEVRLVNRHAARVQAVLDTAFDAILTFDSGGRILTANRAAERMFGRPAGELDGQPLQRHLRWGGQPGRAGAPELPATGVVCVAEARRADGQTFPAEFSLGRAGEGEELLYTAIVRDISERVEAERRIRTFAEGLEASNRRLEEVNAQLQEASRLKSEFLANTSHELRTPLNGMIGFLQLVLDGLCESREEEREFLRQGLQCSRHLLGLINDVLDIAKIEAGKLSVEVERVDVGDLFAETETVTHVQARQAGITLRFDPAGADRVFARCDFAKTKQVLINLIGNSIKFTPRGSITVRAHARTELGHVVIEVADTGIGIPPERQRLIFEKFTQGDGSTTRKYGGTGLGLAISRSLVELMGGTIGVHSEGEGKGTRMCFSLPIWEDSAAGIGEGGGTGEDRIEGPANGPLVLVVEDDPVFRRFLASLLHQHGYRTVLSPHAESAWVLMRRLRPAIAVLDYALSCGEGATLRTGWDLAERMTGDPDTRHIPLIFVTGFDAELRERLRATAFSRKPAHLMKPVDGAVLLATLEELLGDVAHRHVRVLMADDDPTVAAFVRRVLPQARYHIEVANNGEECLHVLRSQPRGFDVLLLDLMMPEVSGYDVLREMTLAGTAAELPVVVLTNFPEARTPDEKRLLEQGLVLDVLPKTAVHDNPKLLTHIIEWHLQVAMDGDEEQAA